MMPRAMFDTPLFDVARYAPIFFYFFADFSSF